MEINSNGILNNLINPKTGNKLKLLDLQKGILKDNKYTFISKKGILNLSFNDNSDNVTKKQSIFYNDIKFPNYDEFDDIFELRNKAKKSIFIDKLDKEIPYNSKILEAGCGTGQLCNYLANNNREIVGIDLSENSLQLANKFAFDNKIQNVYFLKMNILENFFKKEYFDVIISNGVLHHTAVPYKSFCELTKLLKKDGIIIIGLYHKYGRLITYFKQFVFKIFHLIVGNKLNNILKKISKKNYAWIKDQYQNPKESSHTLSEITEWFKLNNIKLISSIPFSFDNIDLINKKIFDENTNLIKLSKKRLKLSVIEYLQSLSISQIKENGFFIVIGKKINDI